MLTGDTGDILGLPIQDAGRILAIATIIATIRWREDAHLFAIAVVAFGLGLYGYCARRRDRLYRHTWCVTFVTVGVAQMPDTGSRACSSTAPTVAREWPRSPCGVRWR
jgi:hypothetical protein